MNSVLFFGQRKFFKIDKRSRIEHSCGCRFFGKRKLLSSAFLCIIRRISSTCLEDASSLPVALHTSLRLISSTVTVKVFLIYRFFLRSKTAFDGGQSQARWVKSNQAVYGGLHSYFQSRESVLCCDGSRCRVVSWFAS